MIDYTEEPKRILEGPNRSIASFLNDIADGNLHHKSVSSFGYEWNQFGSFSKDEIERIGEDYFDIVDSSHIDGKSVVLDLGCGSGRWTKYVANKVAFVEAVDPSTSVFAADVLLGDVKNVRITQAEISYLPFPEGSFDFIICLGVLHHIPDTTKAMRDLLSVLKPGGYILLYLYYSKDDMRVFARIMWLLSDLIRKIVSRLPNKTKKRITNMLAYVIYGPLIYITKAVKRFSSNGALYKSIPLHYYYDKSWHIIRNDAYDRFATPLEKRFSKKEIRQMMKSAGLSGIHFSSNPPYWHVVGKKT